MSTKLSFSSVAGFFLLLGLLIIISIRASYLDKPNVESPPIVNFFSDGDDLPSLNDFDGLYALLDALLDNIASLSIKLQNGTITQSELQVLKSLLVKVNGLVAAYQANPFLQSVIANSHELSKLYSKLVHLATDVNVILLERRIKNNQN